MEDTILDQEQQHFKSICAAFFNYQVDSLRDISRMERNFLSLNPAHLSMLPIPYTSRIQKLISSCQSNYFFFIHLVHPHKDLFTHTILSDGKLQMEPLEVPYKNVSKVRSTLRQLVRDWAEEGKIERDMCYKPILNELNRIFPENKENFSVLTPGAGLARLTFEIVSLGFKSQGNEFSYFMLIASDYILNKTNKPEEFEIFPFIHDFSNVLTVNDVFRSIKIPDCCPSLVLNPDAEFSMVAGEFIEVYSKQLETWDCVVTCFFMDTANNIIQYIETIYNTLKPGGYWINFGPLLYHYADMGDELSIELSWEEFRAVVIKMGFLLEQESQQESWYASDVNPMLRISYNCIFFTAVKPKN